MPDRNSEWRMHFDMFGASDYDRRMTVGESRP